MVGLRILCVLILFAVQSFCSPIEKHRSANKRTTVKEDDKGKLSGNVMEDIEKVNKGSDVNLFEGDIDLSPDDVVDNSDAGDVDGQQISVRRKRNAARNRKKLWVTRVIPYVYDSSLPDAYKSTIQEAIAEYENRTCLTFKQRTGEDLFIKFVYQDGCWSSVGRQYWMTGIGQPLSLGSGCNHKGTIMHELMHALGFWHEQSRPDRNLYVEVLWENIAKDEEHNFNKYSHRDIDLLKIPYDFDSIMHYGRKSFSKNGLDTIRSILDPNRLLGQREGLTDFDIHEVNALYDCSTNAGQWSSWSNFGPCSTYCYKERQRFCTSSDFNKDCPGADQYGVQQESIKCSNSECYAPINGHWGRWGSWGPCDADCGLGTHYRTRSCDDPPPKYGGNDCVGSSNSSQSCKLKSCGIGPDDCEFDADMMCHWTNDGNNSPNFKWERHTGRTPSSNTGPSGDHTSGTGYYVFVETSGVPTGSNAKLLSKMFPLTKGRCLSFWYHMYGSGMGELNVYIRPETGALPTTKVWSTTGDQGDEWKMAQVTLTCQAKYEVIFEAVRGSSFRADIGLDDISFKESPCLEALGCFKDKSARALPELVKNIRPQIDWYHMGNTVRDCAKLVQDKGYKVFGVQFYGECWSGAANMVQYDKYGVAPPEKCWEGVGKHWTNYVYKIV